MEVATPPCPEPQARKAKLKRRLKRMEGLSRHAVEVVVGRGGGRRRPAHKLTAREIGFALHELYIFFSCI